ncbi:MAG: hypothetical protein GC152_05530 [Alphaproteobacteria bacterium]|nr:hypothetical protein [Alphaproteobacteria bacterium]
MSEGVDDQRASRRSLAAIAFVDAAIIGAGLFIHARSHDILHLVVAAFIAGGVTIPMLVRWADRHGRGGRGRGGRSRA